MSYLAKEVDGAIRVLVGKRWRPGKEYTCEHCSMVFFAPAHRSGRNPVKYCTRMCSNDAKAIRFRRQTAKRCIICSEWFSVPHSKLTRYKTCGEPECSTELKRRITTERHISTGQRVFVKQ